MANVSAAIWPGASTLPGSSTIPGQGNLPLVRCRISTDDFATANPTWIDATTDMRSFSVSRGRENELSQFDAGTASIVLDDRDRQWDPTIHSDVRPMNRVWLYEEFSGEVHDLFYGYAESWHEDWPDGSWSNATSTVEASDEYQVIAAQKCVVGAANPYTTLDVWVRISSILDDAQNHAPRVSHIGSTATTGVTVSFNYEGQAITDAVSALLPSSYRGILQTTGYSDAVLLVTASGTFAYFYSDHRDSAPFDSAQATFGDGIGELPYVDLDTDYSRSFLFNKWTVTSIDSTFEEYDDPTSELQYGVRENSRTVLFPSVDSTNGGLAQTLTAKYSTPFERVTSVSFDTTLPEVSEALFRRELMDCIRVLRTPPGGGARIDQTLYIQKIEVSGANDRKPWNVRWGVSPL